MDGFNLQKENYFTKLIAVVFLLLINTFSIYAQNSTDRKQLFDYDWKFFLGDADGDKSNKQIIYIA